MSYDWRSRARLAAVLAVALMVRLGCAAWWQHNHVAEGAAFAFPDSDSYWELGLQLARGEPYEFRTPHRRVFRAPGYPLLLAASASAFGNNFTPLAARAVGAVVGTLTIGVLYWLARRIYDQRVALWAATMGALYPGAVFTSILVLADGLFCALMVVHLSLWLEAQRAKRHRIAWALAAGAIAGLATLTRPSWLLFVPFGLLTLAAVLPNRRQTLIVGAAMCGGLVAVCAPWWIRNWQVTNHFVPTTLQVGASLYDSLGPQADGSSNMQFVAKFERELRADGVEHPDFEYQLDRKMRDAALAAAAENPWRVIRLAGVKLFRMWNVWPNEPTLRSWPVRVAVACSFLPLVVGAGIASWRLRGGRLAVLLLTLPAVYLTLLHMVFVGSLRYRQPALLPLAILAAVTLSAFIEGRQSTSRQPSTNRKSLPS